MQAASLDKINQDLLLLKSRNEKPTQINVSKVSGLSIRTVKVHWKKRRIEDSTFAK